MLRDSLDHAARYAQEIERARRDQAYAAYYQQRNVAEVAEEAEYLADFALVY